MKHLALITTALALVVAAPAAAQTYTGGSGTFTSLGDQLNSGFDIAAFAPISGTFAGPGTYDINTVTFTVGGNTNGPVPYSFGGTFLITGGNVAGIPVNYNVAYTGTIGQVVDSITVGGNYVSILGQGVHINALTLSNGDINNPVSGILTATVGGVPEPTTWALMIMGFGAVGGAMRRRSAVRTSVRYA